MKFSSKQIVVISVGVIVLLIILYFAYRYGKKTNPSHTKVGEDVYGTPLTEEEKVYLESLADSLYSDMDGLNFAGHEDLIYQNLANLSDSHLVVVSNVFNAKYQKGEETFLQWLKNENFSWDSFTNQDIVDVVISRLVGQGVR